MMKIPILLLLAISIVFANTGCEKDPLDRPVPADPSDTSLSIPDTSIISIPANTAPNANAGADRIVEFRANETFLSGSVSHWENDLKEFIWTKVSGPDSYTLENKNAMRTRLSGMEKGIYQFEFTVIDSSGLYDKDTMMVIVGEISADPKEMFFNDVTWSNDAVLWGSIVAVTNIYSFLRVGSVFKVYIQSTNLPAWTEVKQLDETDNYSFFLKDGNLHVYSQSDQSGVASIKIAY